MSDDELDESDVMRVLELADNHLEEAENIIWEASSSTTSDEFASALENLTAQVWEIQHRIYDLERDLEKDNPRRDDGFVYRDQ